MISYTIPDLHVREHTVEVPLDWSDPASESITVFARELVDPMRKDEDLPCLLFLQGGPGGKSPRPAGSVPWITQALKTFRVILMDQRGTGRSTPVSGRRMASMPADEGADYLACFLADSIVADAEHLRKTVFGGRRWSTLGQSYGGFLTLTYLSAAPEGLAACYVTGGLPGLEPSAAEVYRRTYPRVAARTQSYYARYPHDVEQIGRIADRLAGDDVRLVDGDRLTVRRFQSIGIDFGMKPGLERIHWLVDEAFDGDELSDTFLEQVRALTSYRSGPLFAALQESIYGSGSGATAWAAEAERALRPEFAEDARPLLLTGEMMYPWMFAEIQGLRPFQGAVEVLAQRAHWPELYDVERLAENDVPVAAAVYFDDMYVDSGLQLDTARRVGNVQAWVTNEYEHDGLGSDRVFERLTELVRSVGGGVAG
ncbi:alpha/beta fold hydrolase [Kribbella sp. NPDC056951]|uniref:alpha/beta fold hydrolase n=1 Tax=Kribbella sp. NPDC056951 TaxID=3345978 RepID=UPI0036424180